MKIFLKTLIGQSIGITIDDSDTVTGLEIKQLIQKKKNIDIAEQSIIVAGRKWEDNQTYSELKESNPHLPSELNQAHLRLINTPIPKHLRNLVAMNYDELKKFSEELTTALSKDSQTLRSQEEIRINTETYWNDLSTHERVKVLSNPKYNEFTGID